MSERLRGLAITVAIAGGGVAAVFIGLRLLLGSGATETAQAIAKAIWGKDGWTDAIGKFISPIFQQKISQGEKAAESRRDTFQRAIDEGRSVKEAFALVGIGTELPEGRTGLEVLAVGQISSASVILQSNIARAKRGLPPELIKNDWIRENFGDFLLARNKTLASFGVPGSREQAKALNEFVRTLNLTEIKTILGPDALQAAVTARALTLETAS